MVDSQTADIAQRWQDAINSIVHELKSPTASLKMLLQTLDQHMQQPNFDAKKDREIVVMSLKQTERLTFLINDLLDIARMEQGHLQYHFAIVPISSLVQGLVQTMEASNPSHKFILYLQSNAQVYADKLRLEQALTNLIVNAVKYSPANTTITIALAEEHGKVAISVSDEGIGITPDQQQHLFDLYYRAPNATVKGLGIGLPLSYGIIKAHKGDITVASGAKGSTFTIVLPKA